MYPTFTGSSRKPRQVNLSGRSNNPFASPSAQTSSPSQTTSRAVLHAQQERLARQQERERILAAKAVQRTWRGHVSRRTTRQIYREDWDRREVASQYECEEEVLAQIRLLIRFSSPQKDEDVVRVTQCASRTLEWLSVNSTRNGAMERWHFPMLRLNRLICAILNRGTGLSGLKDGALETFLKFLKESTHYTGACVGSYTLMYYEALSRVLQTPDVLRRCDFSLVQDALVAPLLIPTTEAPLEYRSFASEILTVPDLITSERDNQGLFQFVDPQKLAKSMREMLSVDLDSKLVHEKGSESTLWLLSYFIYVCHHATGEVRLDQGFSADRIYVVSTLLSPLAEEINLRLNGLSQSSAVPLPAFIHGQLLTLVNQKTITALLSQSTPTANGLDHDRILSNDAATLATFALTLLRIFPRRADEIQMWLNMGTVPRVKDGLGVKRPPAVKYLWEAASKTAVYRSVCQNPQNAVKLLQPDGKAREIDSVLSKSNALVEWKILLLFMELYTFILKVTDDEEFMNREPTNQGQTWTRQSSLELTQVQELTLFLKNFAFAMYWHGPRILGNEEPRNNASLAGYFRTTDASTESRKVEASKSFENITVEGLNGVSLTYMKGLTTGLLRMIYERDSRRKFLPPGFWLMTDYFDMEGFIPAVVKEESFKNKAQDDGGLEDEEDAFPDLSDGYNDEDILVGTSRTQQVRRIDKLRKQQRKNARQKQLEAITPRLEILQNMPFFIPFITRVEIFHQFILEDKNLRREGYPDPDEWRLSVVERLSRQRGEMGRIEARNRLRGQHARIRRDFCFDDAYAQYYGLGEGLKEPIQITFVDQFDTPEAGIDGGGVTKEFLTSVTNEAFTPTAGLNMFIENDQNLLYPNSSAVDERKEYLREAGIKEGTSDWKEAVWDLLRRYEFLGRIIGKCLYEGILIDIQFAPFFLVKWALTGGSGSATNESNYRANLNDLRDLDETLYQGLLKLKNYSGNVEDFSLDFTVTDTISTSYQDMDVNGAPTQKTITRDLRPNGSEIPVTNENRLVYISFMARHRLQVQPHAQTSAFLRGLGAMIQPSWLSMFNQSELQTLVGGGTSEIDVSDLRRNTYYGGVFVIGDDNEEHPTVKMFWEVMQAFSDQQRRKVLKYVTSTPRGPLLGFGTLNPRFNIRDSGSDQARLPSTSTCVNLLKLPIYHSKVVLREKLEYAIESGAGFDLS